MDLQEAKSAIEAVEELMPDQPYVLVATFDRDGRTLGLAVTERLRRACKKAKVWKSKRFLTAFKNAQYGFDATRPRSGGGSDGVFVLTRDYRPKNEMMRKLFDRYLDRPGSGVGEVAASLGCAASDLVPVRVVSHHLRLLGVLHRGEQSDRLVLVDYDDTK